MGYIISNLITLLTTLIIVRMYLTNSRFRSLCNKLLGSLEDLGFNLRHSKPAKFFFGPIASSLPSLILTLWVFFILFIPFGLLAGIFWLSFLILIYPWLVYRLSQTPPSTFDTILKSVQDATISPKKLWQLKQAIKQYHSQPPSDPYAEAASSIGMLALIFEFLIFYPTLLLHRFITWISRFPAFENWFDTSPFHDRFVPYHHLATMIQTYLHNHPIRMRIESIEVSEDLAIFNLGPQNQHSQAKVKHLAKYLEQELDLPAGSVMIQATDEHDRLLVPLASLTTPHTS